jgi:hypothetical protein
MRCKQTLGNEMLVLTTRRREIFALSYSTDRPKFSQQRSESSAWIRGWLPSCLGMIRIGPLFFWGTRGGYRRTCTAGSKAYSREASPRRGVHWLPTTSPSYTSMGEEYAQ